MEKIYTEENGEYLKKNPDWHIQDSPWKAKQILKMLDRNSIQPKSIVEIGCGAGEILNQLHSQLTNDIQYFGYDISKDAILLAQTRTKDRLTFRQENLLNLDVNYDLLLMIDVFEHVEDYIGFLTACRKKSQYSIFHIPLDISAQGIMRNMLMHARKSVGHLHYFTKDTALATLKDTGYEIIDSFYTAGSLELPRKALKSRIALYPRKILFSTMPDFTVKLMGGFSFMVLTKNY